MTAIRGHEFYDYGVEMCGPNMTMADYCAESEALRGRFKADIERNLTRMTGLAKRCGDDGMTPKEIADTLREWIYDALKEMYAR